jgi:hypothetical protein
MAAPNVGSWIRIRAHLEKSGEARGLGWWSCNAGSPDRVQQGVSGRPLLQ